MDAIYRKEKLRKLAPDEIKKLSDENTKVNHISSKYLNLFKIIIIVVLLCKFAVGKSSLINT